MNASASIAISNPVIRRSGPFSLKLLLASFPEKTAKKGELIARKNHNSDSIYFLNSGMVKSMSYVPERNKEVVDGYYTSGELMNLENWNTNTSLHPSLKVTSSQAVYKVIPINEFRQLVLQNQGLSQLVLQSLSEKITKNKDRIHRLLLSKSRQRVIQFLMDYVEEVGQRVGYEYVIKKPFTHDEMGQLSDTSRQTVTTVLNELKAANIIHFTRRYIVFRNLEQLADESKVNK